MPMVDERKAIGRLQTRENRRGTKTENNAPRLTNEFVRIETNFDPIVQQGEERSDGKRRDEDRDETELEN